MESPLLQNASLPYPKAGSDVVESVRFIPDHSPDLTLALSGGEGNTTHGKVFINATQYFGNVSATAWNFYIGGYQPAQKWLKDRKGKALSNEDIEHYQKIICILENTDRIMKEIDGVSDY